MDEYRLMPRRFRVLNVSDEGRVFPHAYRWGTYFPGTDLVVYDMGQRGTGAPTRNVEWIDPPPAHVLAAARQAS